MSHENIEATLVAALYRFAWALAGEEAAAALLTQNVLAHDHYPLPIPGAHLGKAVFAAAFRLHTAGKTLPVPPVHDRVSSLTPLSLQHAQALRSDSLLRSFRELELPQRAALVLFYTTRCSLQDIAAILQRSDEETVAIISRGKAEWLHILERCGSEPPHDEGKP